MDQIKIGKFIARCRRKVNLTQMQLAEMLNITDRAVSKWECGKAMPDSSIMLDLCDILHINVNSLLCGEEIEMENYNKELENKLIELVKQKEANDKCLLTLEYVVIGLSLLLLFVPVVISLLIDLPEWKRVLIVLAGFVPCVVGCVFAIRIEQIAGYYECAKCKHRYVPNFTAVSLSMHFGRTRYMTCPHCHEKSWQKKVTGESRDENEAEENEE